MAKKISQFNSATTIKSGDISVVVQDGETKQFPLDLLATKAQADEYKSDVETQLADYEQEITNIKNQYDKELYTPTITVTNTSMVKTGQGDTVDYSASVEDGVAKSAILSGCTKYRDIDTGDVLDTFDETKNLELVSVKMPVLTTTGKNLLCSENSVFNASSDRIYRKIYLKPNTDYYMSAENGHFFSYRVMLCKNDGDVNKLPTELKQLSRKFNSENYSGEFFILFHATRLYENYGNKWAQVEEGTVATSYEPFKSNILTTPEDLELRGIGDVKDELDLTTGELTQRVNEVVLDGSEVWSSNALLDNGIMIYMCQTYTDGKITSDNVISATLPLYNLNYLKGLATSDGLPNIFLTTTTSTGKINLAFKTQFSNLDQLKQWLSQNPLTVQYQLKTESVKTVVLNPSGTLASETPYMWKNGSIQLSSDSLVPGLDYAVTTSRVGVIETNVAETIANEKRIHTLEVMLAQSTITAAADAVSLQSDLESTTMSVDGVDLDTENTQDNFLYEMILLLIEKDAYDESLFDKVCALYLYGKLSDEQFTNIYNLLYPVNPEEE